jgi:NtrC-family two-component system sensor histidine kinase KinB
MVGTDKMPWGVLIDGILWAAALAVSVFLARLVFRREDLPARLFLGMVIALVVPQVHHLVGCLVELFSWLFPGAISEGVIDFFATMWPVDTAAVVVFGCLTLHLFLVFPTESRIVRNWRWSPLLFYMPGVFLVAMLLSRLGLESGPLLSFWELIGLGPRDATLPLLFTFLTLGTALARLSVIYFSRASPLVRQQLAWILWGLVAGGGLVVITDLLPRMAGLSPLVGSVPGVRQLPILIVLGAFALSMQRFHVFDADVVISRSVVYTVLVVVITVLYLALGTLSGSLLQLWSADISPLTASILTVLIIVSVALPLRDAIQRLVDRLFLRRRTDYRRSLQDFSRALTTPVPLLRLKAIVADQIEQVLHPAGVAIVWADGGTGYRVALSRGELAAHPLWREETHLLPTHFASTLIATRRRPVYLPWHGYEVAEDRKQEWLDMEESGVHVFIPMHLRDSLVGWFALGPKLSELLYTRRDLEFLSALADQSCVALENARLYGEMQQQTKELALLARVSSAISSSLHLERVLRTIVESVIQVIDCDKSAIFELSEDGSELSLRMSKGLSQAYIQHSRHLSVGGDNRSLAIASGEPLMVPDIRAEPLLADLVELAEREGYRAVVDLPLAGREGFLGVLSVYFDRVYTPSIGELEVLTTFANHAAIAIENARLYAAMTRERDRARWLYEQTDAALARRVEELTSIEEISRQLTSTLDLQQVMDLVLERVMQATQADRGVIALYESAKHGLRLLAQVGYPVELDRYRKQPWSDTRGITARVARTGIAALLPDVTRDPDYVAVAPTTLSQISVPIVHEGQVIGVTTLEGDRLSAFTPEHLRFAELLAGHAAIGINNARLFQQVMEGRDRLQAILNSSQDVVIVLDTHGRVILTNPRVAELFGQAAEEWLHASNVLDAAPLLVDSILQATDLDAEGLADIVRQLREHPHRIVHVAFRFQASGQQRHVEGTASPVLSETGEVIGRVAVLRDVTRQQELEQFREDLTSMVIHNLQGPLAAVISGLETLQELEGDDLAMADELLGIALGSGRSLYRRIESVLWLRRLEDNQFPLNLQFLWLPDAVQPVLDECRAAATRKGVCLEADFAEDLPFVAADEEVIGRVFSNLLDNALKYTPAGGRINVWTALQRGDESSIVLCAVADTGAGISESAAGVIFDRFRRGTQPPGGPYRGMGIGLHYCKLAVEAHGGRIWVESQPGQGSTFFFTLPAVAAE